jgi:hypothetical protein
VNSASRSSRTSIDPYGCTRSLRRASASSSRRFAPPPRRRSIAYPPFAPPTPTENALSWPCENTARPAASPWTSFPSEPSALTPQERSRSWKRSDATSRDPRPSSSDVGRSASRSLASTSMCRKGSRSTSVVSASSVTDASSAETCRGVPGTPLVRVRIFSLLGTADLWRVPAAWVGRPFREVIKALRRGPQGELPPPRDETHRR